MQKGISFLLREGVLEPLGRLKGSLSPLPTTSQGYYPRQSPLKSLRRP